jgi:hypothetical protein
VFAHEVYDRAFKGASDAIHGVEPGTSVPVLNQADRLLFEAGTLGELLLREARPVTRVPDLVADVAPVGEEIRGQFGAHVFTVCEM